MNYLKLQQELIRELVNEPKKKQFIRIGFVLPVRVPKEKKECAE